MKILSLDISSKTGYAIGTSTDKGFTLLQCGVLSKKEKPDAPYPKDYYLWAFNIYEAIEVLIDLKRPDLICIEETSKGSKSAYSQKILEWVHYLVARKIINAKENGLSDYTFLMTGEWRGLVGCAMTKEEKKKNQLVKKEKKAGINVSKNEAGKRIGITNKKHVNIRRVKELFNIDLKVKENDIADGILLCYAAHVKKFEIKNPGNDIIFHKELENV